MRIEPYTEIRRSEVCELVKIFFDENLHDISLKLDDRALNNSIDRLKSHTFILIIDNKSVGIFAGYETQTPFSFDKIFHQVIWYVKKEYRNKSIFFFKHIIKMLESMDYKLVVTTLLPHKEFKRRSKFFNRLGFKHLETHFIKTL